MSQVPPSGEYQPFVPPAQPHPQPQQSAAPLPPNPGFPTGGYGSPYRPNEQLKSDNRGTLTFGIVMIGLSVLGGGILLAVFAAVIVFANLAS